MQTEVNINPRAMSQEEKDAQASNPTLNLENAFIDIDGKRYRLVELLRPLIEKYPS